MASRDSQCARAVLMVRPAAFGFNPETAPTNAFQDSVAVVPEAAAAALREFDAAAAALDRAGIEVLVGRDTPVPHKPDAIFPNNWVSFHADGTVVLYPMLAANRRLERRDALVHQVAEQGSYRITRTVDLSGHERQARFLEGTGSLVLDRPGRIAYAALSPRTDLEVLADFARQLDYEICAFEAFDSAGLAIYHTNVLLAVGPRVAILCAEAVANPDQRSAVRVRLAASGHEVIEISRGQMQQFAGNVLVLAAPAGDVIAMSTTAWGAFTDAQRRTLGRHGTVLTVEIPTIERLGGGGMRCMLAEIHLPKRLP
jgi:hypothetical protein